MEGLQRGRVVGHGGVRQRGAAEGCGRGVWQRGGTRMGYLIHLESPSASCMSRFIVFYYCDDFSKVKVKVKV